MNCRDLIYCLFGAKLQQNHNKIRQPAKFCHSSGHSPTCPPITATCLAPDTVSCSLPAWTIGQGSHMNPYIKKIPDA